MRILGLDVGDRTIGVAVSDALGWTAQGVEVIRRRDWESDVRRLREICAEYEISLIVVGYPKNMNGTIGPRAELSAQFAAQISQELALPVKLWDERLTTMEAEKMLVAADVSRAKRRKVIDKMGAVLLLQNYLAAQAAAERDKKR